MSTNDGMSELMRSLRGPDLSGLEIDTTERDKAVETAAATKATADVMAKMLARTEELATEAETREAEMLRWARISGIAAVIAAVLALAAIIVTVAVA